MPGLAQGMCRAVGMSEGLRLRKRRYMANKMIDALVYCPFYISEAKTSITCEGIIGDKTVKFTKLKLHLIELNTVLLFYISYLRGVLVLLKSAT